MQSIQFPGRALFGKKALLLSMAVILIILTSSSFSAFAYSNQAVYSHPNQRITNSTSSNWSGYATESSIASPSNNFIQSVTGSWTVPSLTCTPGQDTYVAVWVGIDGYSDNTVEQTGTEQDCVGGAQISYAWYEMYPKGMIEQFYVNPGDKISASVSSQGSGLFALTLSDSSGGSLSTTQKLSQAKLQSAEWIVEAPSSSHVLPLGDFGTVSFSGAQYTTTSGDSFAINGYGVNSYDAITMNDTTNGAIATPSSLSKSGTSFSVTYSSSSSSGGGHGSSGSLGVAISCNVQTCSYAPNSFAYITVTVTSSPGSVPVSGASVTLTITRPGGIASGSGTTNSSGQIVFKYRISPHAATGTYSISAAATFDGSSGSNTGTLTVS